MKEKILEGASDLFHRYGIRSVSMDDVARHLSISKKTIYQYYKDKNEIVTEGIKAHLEQEKCEMNSIFEGAGNAVQELTGVSQCMRRHFKELNPALLYDMQKYHATAWDVFLKFKDDFVKNSVVRNLERGIAEGVYRPDINVEILAVLRVEQIQMAFDVEAYPRDQFDFRDVQMEMLDHFMHGIVTDKGRQLLTQFKESENNKS